MQWHPIETAPSGRYIKVPIGKENERKIFVGKKVLLWLNDRIFLTWKLEDGRWNGLSKKDNPTHWMHLPDAPCDE